MGGWDGVRLACLLSRVRYRRMVRDTDGTMTVSL